MRGATAPLILRRFHMRRLYIISAIFFLLLFGASCNCHSSTVSNSNSSPELSDILGTDNSQTPGADSESSNGKQEIIDAIISALEEKLVINEADIISTFSNGEIKYIDIQTADTADQFFQCIKGYKEIIDLTDIPIAPMNFPVLINGEGIGYFYSAYVVVPKLDKFYCVTFAEADTNAFLEHIDQLISTNRYIEK